MSDGAALIPVAEHGFPRGGANFPPAVCQPIILLYFCRKLHGNEGIGTQGRARAPGAPWNSLTKISKK